MPPRPPRVNQSQIYSNGISGDQSIDGTTPGGSASQGNYRKVFKPNIPGKSEIDKNSFDSLEQANAMALGGHTPTQNQRR